MQRGSYVRNVEAAMAKAGMKSWYALAQAAGLKINTVYRYRAGDRIPGMVPALAIARVLGTTAEALVEEPRS